MQAIVNFLRVLRDGGIIFLAVPNRRSTFDRVRPLTEVNHLIDVFETGHDSHIEEHYLEVVKLVIQHNNANG